MVKNPPSNVGDVGSIPGWGAKIPHAMGQLSPMPQLESPLALESMLHKRFPATEPVQRRTDPVLQKKKKKKRLWGEGQKLFKKKKSETLDTPS